jgi:hypothetical protein
MINSLEGCVGAIGSAVTLNQQQSELVEQVKNLNEQATTLLATAVELNGEKMNLIVAAKEYLDTTAATIFELTSGENESAQMYLVTGTAAEEIQGIVATTGIELETLQQHIGAVHPSIEDSVNQLASSESEITDFQTSAAGLR